MHMNIDNSGLITQSFNSLLFYIPTVLTLAIYVLGIYALILFIKCCQIYIKNH